MPTFTASAIYQNKGEFVARNEDLIINVYMGKPSNVPKFNMAPLEQHTKKMTDRKRSGRRRRSRKWGRRG